MASDCLNRLNMRPGYFVNCFQRILYFHGERLPKALKYEAWLFCKLFPTYFIFFMASDCLNRLNMRPGDFVNCFQRILCKFFNVFHHGERLPKALKYEAWLFCKLFPTYFIYFMTSDCLKRFNMRPGYFVNCFQRILWFFIASDCLKRLNMRPGYFVNCFQRIL